MKRGMLDEGGAGLCGDENDGDVRRRARRGNKQEEKTVVFALYSALTVAIYSTDHGALLHESDDVTNHTRPCLAPFGKQRDEGEEELLL